MLAAEARASFEGVEFGYAVLGGLDVGGGSGTDIVIGGAPMYDVAIFLDDLWGVGIPQGTFTAESTLLDAPDVDFGRSLTALGDLTGDGSVDLFVPHRDGGQSYLFVNDGDGGFDERHAVGPQRSATRAVTLGDLNGDGLLDIVVGDQVEGGARLYINRGDASFEEPRVIGDPDDTVYALAVADLDGDGDEDVVVGNARAPGAILSNDGSGDGFTLTRFGDAQGAVYGMAIGDVNGDGIADIVAGRSGAPNTLYLGR